MGCLAPFRIMVSGLNPMDDHQFPPFKNSSDHKLRVTPHFWTTQISSLVHMWFQIHYIYNYIFIYPIYKKPKYHKSLPSPIFSCPCVIPRRRWVSLGVPNAKTALGVFGDSGGEPQARSDAFFKATTGIHHIKRGIPPHTNVYILYIYSIV